MEKCVLIVPGLRGSGPRTLDARFVDAGDAGHIDGPWPKGERVLAWLFSLAEARERELALAMAISN